MIGLVASQSNRYGTKKTISITLNFQVDTLVLTGVALTGSTQTFCHLCIQKKKKKMVEMVNTVKINRNQKAGQKGENVHVNETDTNTRVQNYTPAHKI